jgi:HK97 gp10 family phage protein
VVGADYAPDVEFGTYKMIAQPFLRPAIDEHQGDILKAIAVEMQKEIKNLVA